MEIINFIFKLVSLTDLFLLILGIISFLRSYLSRNDKEKMKRYFEQGMYCIYFSAFLSLVNNFCSKVGIFN